MNLFTVVISDPDNNNWRLYHIRADDWTSARTIGQERYAAEVLPTMEWQGDEATRFREPNYALVFAGHHEDLTPESIAMQVDDPGDAP